MSDKDIGFEKKKSLFFDEVDFIHPREWNKKEKRSYSGSPMITSYPKRKSESTEATNVKIKSDFFSYL